MKRSRIGTVTTRLFQKSVSEKFDFARDFITLSEL
jgi:hypothetical protein